MSRIKYIIISLLLFIFFPLTADMSFESIYRDWLYMQSVTSERKATSLNFHSYSSDLLGVDLGWSDRATSYPILETAAGTLSHTPFSTFLSFNSHKVYGRNDGALWQGRGFNNISTFALDWQHPLFTIRFNPEFWIAQNSDVEIVTTTISKGYGDHWDEKGYDSLQRYGSSEFYDYSWGDSDIRFRYKEYFSLGLSNENIILGPGRQSNILLSDNAAGFPHIDMGTYRPVTIPYVGDFEARAIWGSFHESPYYDDDPDNDRSYITGLFLAIAPPILPGFILGINNLYYIPLSTWTPFDLIGAFIPFMRNNYDLSEADEDRMISLTFDWKFPSIGFNVYGEWAKNDSSDFIYAPEHTTAEIIGVTQSISLKNPDEHLLLSFEFANLGQKRTTMARTAAGPWYRHAWTGHKQGYANNGQVLGAGIGPGSNLQWLNLAYYWLKGKSSFTLERICYDNDYFYNVVIPEGNSAPKGSYVDLVAGIDCLFYLNDINLYGRADLISTRNYIWELGDNFWNTHLEFGISYQY